MPDVAIQYYVLQGSGLAIARAGILHISNQYVYDGRKLELESLFSFSDLTEQVTSIQGVISSQLDDLKRMLAGTDPPEIFPSRLCNSPYGCEFWEYCTREIPEFWVLNLSGIYQKRLNELAALNIRDIRDIPNSLYSGSLLSSMSSYLGFRGCSTRVLPYFLSCLKVASPSSLETTT